MDEKRRDKRIPAKMSLEISSLFKQDYVLVDNIDAPIEIVDISKGGIGFRTRSTLPIGFYFNARIQLGNEDAKIYSVVKIIRREELGDGVFSYGCELVGVAPVLSYIFEDYEKAYEQEK